jgi:hypothetical protein
MRNAHEEAVSHLRFCNRFLLNFLIYEENFIFIFIRVQLPVDRQVPGAPEARDIVRIPPVMVEVPKKQESK